MRKLKKKIYFRTWATLLLVLFLIRLVFSPGTSTPPAETDSDTLFVVPEQTVSTPEQTAVAEVTEPVEGDEEHVEQAELQEVQPAAGPGQPAQGGYHRINSVPSYQNCFPDLQEVQIRAARKWGVSPVRNRAEAERRKSELVYVGASPYFTIDPGMQSSIPYLVPRAADLLQDIGRAYFDSLHVKGVPLHRVLVSSVLRTEEDVVKLMRKNGNASDQSCHRFGTTFDIAYNRYNTVCPPGEQRRAVTNDTLKWVLSEVLRDYREAGRCYVKYETKQGCFHITVR